MNYQVALSSCWLSSRHDDGYAMLKEIADLGFEYAELSHGIRVTLIPGILKAVDEGWIKISSTHNFMPLPIGVFHASPNYYQPSSPNRQERDMWVSQTLNTLDMTTKVHAPKVVMHSGSIIGRFLFDPFRKVEKIRESRGPDADLTEDLPYLDALEKANSKVMKKADVALQNIIQSYTRVLTEAKNLGLKLCAENREGFMELPLDNKFSHFLNQLPEQEAVGYWHDCGHAQIKQMAGLTTQMDLLTVNNDRLAGFHIHDVTGHDQDHQEMGTGSIDFEAISQFFRPDQALVLELHPRLKVEAVKASHEYLLDLLKRKDAAE